MKDFLKGIIAHLVKIPLESLELGQSHVVKGRKVDSHKGLN